METVVISQKARTRIIELAYTLKVDVEAGNVWGGVARTEEGLAEIVTVESKRLAGLEHRSAYFESLPRPQRDGTEPSKYASITITRIQHAKVAQAAAERDQPMSRIVGDLIDQNL